MSFGLNYFGDFWSFTLSPYATLRMQQEARCCQGTSVIPALRRLSQESHEFEVNLGHIVRPCLNNNNKKECKKQIEQLGSFLYNVPYDYLWKELKIPSSTDENILTMTGLLSVLVYLVCYNKIPSTGGL
jgi:hypothetical protein